jgi:hypothetical protein
VSPDGAQIAFVRPEQHGATPDADLWLVPRNNHDPATKLADLPLTDEGGPVWSRDGRFVFATSLLRGAEGNPLFSSVIVIDLQDHVARILEDRVGPISRLTPAIVAPRLDAKALDSDPEYLPELARITQRAIEEQTR